LSLDIIATQLKPKIYNSSQLSYGCLTFKIFYLYCGSQLNWMKNLKFVEKKQNPVASHRKTAYKFVWSRG